MAGLLPDTGTATLFHGISAEARAALVTTLAKEWAKQTSVLLVTDPRRAQELATEAETYAQWLTPKTTLEVLHFPEEPPPDIDATRRADRICERLTVLSALLRPSKNARLIVATPEALLGACPDRTHFESRQLKLRTGEAHPFKALIDTFIHELDYDSEALCEHPGQLATRGGLIDIYPYDANQPYRLDFFGDEIESIRTFDPSTQRTLENVQSITVSAAESAKDAAASDGKFIDYLSEAPIAWLLEEPSQLVREHPYRFEKLTNTSGNIRSLEQVFALRTAANDLRLGICSVDTDPVLFDGAARVELTTEPTENYRHHTDAVQVGFDRFESEQSARNKFESNIADWAKKEKRTLYFVTASESEASRIAELLADNPLTAKLKPKYLHGTISGGFLCSGAPTWLPLKQTKTSKGIVLITDTEYFGRQRRKINRTQERARPTISQVDQLLDFTELADGDPLVHLQHGVCLFRGLSKLEIQGGTKEVITVEFADQMTVHVPLHESHLLTRYVGLTKSSPKLGKIGGAAWDKTRAAAEIATLDYAAELLTLHAERSQHGGYQFPSDHPWQATFEGAFPFSETPDQLTAIEATKSDMEAAQPMDRLICGDVGFGKTEVAIRAALKAVLAGKQVALLVPTTVLCQQHLNTFRERMAEYPIIIDMVSRFRSAKQNREIIANLAEGRIDIVIGTHRLLSKDVHFQDLGLLVVDEEQRFGVKQKERIKQLRANVDILTLSATPIPRTLYMALAGARAMSVIETPPVNRRPIETIVKSYSADLIKSAIQAETDRGGQVFYLHNRVSTIEGVANQVREMHPKLRVAVGHGQMEEGHLEKIMTKFVAGDFDVLVCTTIIESGIDIPNCNTLIIEGADRFGLAQLYQIRGRVGRFKRQAYAYLLLHRHAALVDNAQKRLNALKQHNQLGAGFRIAMRDLELRGAGNLLGSQQSGHIAGVGFELYCQLLKQSVARLKGEPGADRIRAEVKLDFIATGEGGSRSRRTSGSFAFAAIKEAEYSGDHSDQLIEAALPADYVAEPRLRIDLYRRLALANTDAIIQEIAEELVDRFGKLPRATQALIEVSRVRVFAEGAGVRRVESESERLICRLALPGKSGEFLKTGARFPRLSAKDPLKRLNEIQKFLIRNQKSTAL
ncbi:MULTISPECIES: transcription-repair coupling factor [unclassified Lentimonas]|uniref:transcription-repair coupling factor n=1 Tax=unclassified Lentimonas TaxID=2630993 RepID=UPI00132A1B51|nr:MULTISPECIES: transcription-repair coupling factor [unclassified Lentimonas]CAA6679679.1 Transcription-repair coupling factor [Lentimonas sp. CC4]CAA6683554.1 Transcription-repair coupling factor [Lentimonas sp. CC6]CAA7077316.1 Transcription-repair coupling factor [Lentimonas sp. CC4]CAA7170169.1 Transcription-repair coupling factor [Lentimonas sp. CC21]CAA7182443.1 Transcription-repair coupling factor [Lentimonas sp. CC8]